MIETAIIPVAGLATRFLPVSKEVPKALMPVLNKPMIQFAIEEAYFSGIRRILIILGPGQSSIKDYLQNDYATSIKKHISFKNYKLENFIEITNSIQIDYVVQKKPLGLGHAILEAESYIGTNSFSIFLPDDLIFNDSPCMLDMINIYEEFSVPVLAIKEVSSKKIPFLGIIDGDKYKERIYQITKMIEKPTLENAPSNLAIIGRYVLPSGIFSELKHIKPGANGEIQITDALIRFMKHAGFYGYKFPGVHFDVGNPLGLLQASVYTAAADPDIAKDFVNWIYSNVEDFKFNVK